MSSYAKYIVIESQLGAECLIAFSHLLTHAEVGHRLPVVSAGFLFISDKGKAQCFGKSTSLNLESRPEQDTDLANRQICTQE